MAIPQIEPYVNTVNTTDPLVETMAKDRTDIGANAAGKPKLAQNGMALQHVAGGVGGARG